ncbi:hypothetical protein Glove_478g12 [Diversispora epigaea]|uniref:Protein kinase domain-containing protein n=1 Tax=Diversispora epigaea TaxID=1348612 RepID=A0A397GLR7_9GLOM|nr:hypothetical protein Glove_478g12 [Diversispora epigaea]
MGGFGICVKVEDLDGQVFALKAIKKDLLEQNFDDILNEINIQKQLNHQNIVTLYDVFDDDDFVYFKMELCSNQSLFDMKNILHRDLKLENIFISEDMDLKVGDFGLSIELESTDQRFNYSCGTVTYMAPEVLNTKIGHSFEADIWSLGVIMFMMIFGELPFGVGDRSEVINQILNIGYDFPENTGVSDEAVDLIYLILNPEYDARLTIPEIRHHPFFNSATPPGLYLHAKLF